MDLAMMNNSLECAMQSLEQEINYNDNFQSPTWSSSDIISNNEELLSFIGDSSFNIQFMEGLEKLNSPSKLDKEADIRDSLVEFLQEQLKTSDINASRWNDFDSNTNGSTSNSLLPCNFSDFKHTFDIEKESNANDPFFKCNLCSFVSNNEGDVSLHLQLHPEQKFVPSEFVLSARKGQGADYPSNSSNFLNSITKQSPSITTNDVHSFLNVTKQYNCKLCNYSAPKRCILKVHIFTHIGDQTCICFVCGYKSHISTYLSHMKQHANLNLECPFCCFKTSDDNVLMRHILVHEKSIECSVCSSPSNNQTATVINQTVPIIFSCPYCPYNSKYESYLRKHLLNHMNKKIFQCFLCDYKAPYKKMLLEHCAKHKGLYFNCKLCDFKTVYRNNFKKHELIHNGERKFACQLCGCKFAQRSNLKAHVATHAGQKDFQCHLCDYKATQKTNLKAHVLTHIGESNLACNICHYKAENRNTLKTHMSVHSTEKIFDCTLCNYRTAHKSGLRRHLRVHSGEKHFVCELCSYKTARKDYINRHMLKHTGEKNFSCSFCDYKTAYRNSLNVHNALVHAADANL